MNLQKSQSESKGRRASSHQRETPICLKMDLSPEGIVAERGEPETGKMSLRNEAGWDETSAQVLPASQPLQDGP